MRIKENHFLLINLARCSLYRKTLLTLLFHNDVDEQAELVSVVGILILLILGSLNPPSLPLSYIFVFPPKCGRVLRPHRRKRPVIFYAAKPPQSEPDILTPGACCIRKCVSKVERFVRGWTFSPKSTRPNVAYVDIETHFVLADPHQFQ